MLAIFSLMSLLFDITASKESTSDQPTTDRADELSSLLSTSEPERVCKGSNCQSQHGAAPVIMSPGEELTQTGLNKIAARELKAKDACAG